MSTPSKGRPVMNAAAMMIMNDIALITYFPVFAAASSIAGTVSGIVMNVVLPRLAGMLGKRLGGEAV